MVRLLYFARLREDLGTGAEALALPAGVTTVAALRAHLMARGGAWASVLANGKALRVAVNQEMADPQTPVKAGDEVAFFPPVTGG
jgi:molybdopterin synthase sulfur carrier subunit